MALENVIFPSCLHLLLLFNNLFHRRSFRHTLVPLLPARYERPQVSNAVLEHV